MILFVSVVLNAVFLEGVNYPWPRPEKCPACNHYKIWGHGFVGRFFSGFSVALPIKRFRCPFCGKVIILRPDTHFSRIQTPVAGIRQCLATRIETGRWPQGEGGPRNRHWLRHFRRKAQIFFPEVKQLAISLFDQFVMADCVPVSQSIKCGIVVPP
jgi:hypothetical protein